MVVTQADWEQFEDWCAATGHPALPTTWATVQSYLNDVPSAESTTARKLATIRSRHAQARAELTNAPPQPPAQTPWRTPGDPIDPSAAAAGGADVSRWVDLGEALHHLPVHGFPHAVTARRDAVVLVLAAQGRTRRQIAHLGVGQVRTEPVPGIEDADLPVPCHGQGGIL